MRSRFIFVLLGVALAASVLVDTVASAPSAAAHRRLTSAPYSAAPVMYWSTEARRADVPPSAGPENFGNKFPGEAAVYMGIVHGAMYDAAVAIEGGYETYARYEPPLVA